MNRNFIVLAISAMGLLLAGCASPVVGTWSGSSAAKDAPFSFGSVSFVGDKTFTAEARYGGTTRVQSGTWMTKGKELMLSAGDTKRTYTYKVEGDKLVVTEPKSGHSITLMRTK